MILKDFERSQSVAEEQVHIEIGKADEYRCEKDSHIIDQPKNIKEKELGKASLFTLLISLFLFSLLYSRLTTSHHVMHHVNVVTCLFFIQKKKKNR